MGVMVPAAGSAAYAVLPPAVITMGPPMASGSTAAPARRLIGGPATAGEVDGDHAFAVRDVKRVAVRGDRDAVRVCSDLHWCVYDTGGQINAHHARSRSLSDVGGLAVGTDRETIRVRGKVDRLTNVQRSCVDRNEPTLEATRRRGCRRGRPRSLARCRFRRRPSRCTHVIARVDRYHFGDPTVGAADLQ